MPSDISLCWTASGHQQITPWYLCEHLEIFFTFKCDVAAEEIKIGRMKKKSLYSILNEFDDFNLIKIVIITVLAKCARVCVCAEWMNWGMDTVVAWSEFQKIYYFLPVTLLLVWWPGQARVMTPGYASAHTRYLNLSYLYCLLWQPHWLLIMKIAT